MDDAQLVTVRTYLNKAEAQLAQGALKAAGVDSIVRADDAGGARPHLWLGGVKLLVRARDKERASEILGNS